MTLPTDSLICRRVSDKEALLPNLSCRRPKVVLIDAPGVKVYREGGMESEQAWSLKKRKWLKLHLTNDSRTQVVIRNGGYDTRCCKKSVEAIEAHEWVLPKRNVRLTKDLKNRNKALMGIKGFGGDEVAKGILAKLSGYSSPCGNEFFENKKALWRQVLLEENRDSES